MMRALVTRPKEDATLLAEALRARGVEPVLEPMLHIEPIADARVDLNLARSLDAQGNVDLGLFCAALDRALSHRSILASVGELGYLSGVKRTTASGVTR